MTMGKDEDSRRFVPLVKESSVVVQDCPWLPDDIELVSEKHKKVVRSWQDLDDISIAVLSAEDSTESFHDDDYDKHHRKTRRRTVLLIVVFCAVCMTAIGVVFITVRVFGFGERSSGSAPPPAPSTGTNRTPPSEESPTENPTLRPTSDLLSGVAGATPSPSVAPTSMVPVTFNGADLTDEPSRSPSRIQAETAAPVASPIPTVASETESPVDASAPGGVVLPTDTPTSSPTEESKNSIPEVDAFGLETAEPSVETTSLSSQPTQIFDSIVPSLRPSPSPIEDTAPKVSLEPSFRSTRTCNGLESNCNLRVNELMFATLHNAMSSIEDGFYGPSHALRLEVSLSTDKN